MASGSPIESSPDASSIGANAETLRRFSEAWARGDVDGLMRLMTDAPTYKASVGPGPGAVHRGREQVRAAFSRMFAAPPTPSDPPPPAGEVVFFGNRALSFWTLRGRAPDGSSALVDGVDVMTFDESGRIAVKDSYRKTW
jgi:ketosteroid isomerase-like protein